MLASNDVFKRKKIIMKRISILLYSVLLLVVTSCSPTEEEINAAARNTVNDFFSAFTNKFGILAY